MISYQYRMKLKSILDKKNDKKVCILIFNLKKLEVQGGKKVESIGRIRNICQLNGQFLVLTFPTIANLLGSLSFTLVCHFH